MPSLLSILKQMFALLLRISQVKIVSTIFKNSIKNLKTNENPPFPHASGLSWGEGGEWVKCKGLGIDK